jgi:hypothetical protein
MNDDKFTIIIHTQHGIVSQTYYITNVPAWYELLGIFSLYAIIAMLVFCSGSWIVSRFK